MTAATYTCPRCGITRYRSYTRTQPAACRDCLEAAPAWLALTKERAAEVYRYEAGQVTA